MQPISSASAPAVPIEASGTSMLAGSLDSALGDSSHDSRPDGPPRAVGEIQLGAQRARVFSPAGLQKLDEIQAAVGRPGAADLGRQSAVDVDLQIRG